LAAFALDEGVDEQGEVEAEGLLADPGGFGGSEVPQFDLLIS
jgi:hypothetical protein